MRVRPATGDQLAVPAQQRVRPHQEARPGRARQRAAQRRQQRSIGPRQPWPSRLPPQNSQLVPQHKNLQLLRAARPPQQPHQREQVPHDEIHKRPKRSALPRPRQERRTYRAQRPGEPRTSLRTLRGEPARQRKLGTRQRQGPARRMRALSAAISAPRRSCSVPSAPAQWRDHRFGLDQTPCQPKRGTDFPSPLARPRRGSRGTAELRSCEPSERRPRAPFTVRGFAA
jgi:hypothetical protein